MKLLTTRPSFMCMRGPKVLKILATRTSTPSWNGSGGSEMCFILRSACVLWHFQCPALRICQKSPVFHSKIKMAVLVPLCETCLLVNKPEDYGVMPKNVAMSYLSLPKGRQHEHSGGTCTTLACLQTFFPSKYPCFSNGIMLCSFLYQLFHIFFCKCITNRDLNMRVY